MKKEQMNTIGQIELILSGEPRLRQHPKYAARKKRLNNIINDKCNRSLIDFLKDILLLALQQWVPVLLSLEIGGNQLPSLEMCVRCLLVKHVSLVPVSCYSRLLLLLMVAIVKPLHFGFGIIVMGGDNLINEEHPKMSFQSKYDGLDDVAAKLKHLKENRLF
ncbi:hypothetical protein ACI65C_006635 [Semiaphis heraclei]